MTWPTHFYDLNLDRHPATLTLWNQIHEHPDQIWMLRISDPVAFVESLPDDFKPPIVGRPNSFLPKNIWVGGPLTIWPRILDVGAATRFLVIRGEDPLDGITEAMEAWRCSNCGARGLAPRPSKCLRGHVCGDSKLLPQIHWLVLEGHVGEEFRTAITVAAQAAGVQVHG